MIVSATGRRLRSPCSARSTLERVANRLEAGRQRVRNSERMEPAADVVVLEQLLVANREQRAAQRREDRELIVRPFDRHQRRAQRFDLLAIVERLAANEQMLDAARLERFDVRRA